jgi:23S rRNA pseudouridine1911/1915/1917 synthase
VPKLSKQTQLEADVPRLDVVVAALTGASRAIVRGMFDHGCVTLDGRPCTEAGTPASRGAVLDVSWDPEQRYKEIPRARLSRKFRIAFEDAHLIVVEKVAGILTVPTDRAEQDTLVHEVARYLSKGQRITKKAFIVHRLDRDTSGVLVFAKRQEIADAIKDQFEARKPEREYNALVAGTVREDQGTFRSYLATNEGLDQYSTTATGEGKLAVTHFRVLERVRGATFVRVQLETGRRNQIRVHFAEAGHPVLGDVRYQPERARHPLWTQKRLALHARTLGFTHPVTGQPVRVTSDLPAAFLGFLKAAR